MQDGKSNDVQPPNSTSDAGVKDAAATLNRPTDSGDLDGDVSPGLCFLFSSEYVGTNYLSCQDWVSDLRNPKTVGQVAVGGSAG